jgi:MurNAc alpha-1-phosphate uridylyltransferase
VAVNVHAGRDQMLAHLGRGTDGQAPVHCSIEVERALGTAGALGFLRPWIAGRPSLVLNADAWCQPDLQTFVDGWDGERVRLLLVDDPVFHARSRVAATLMPWSEVVRLEAEPSGLFERSWRSAHADGRLDTAVHDGPFVDCGTPRAYLRANLLAAEATTDGSIVGAGAVVTGELFSSVVGPGAVVQGDVRRSVVWDGCAVSPGEVLDHAIRIDDGRTVLVR